MAQLPSARLQPVTTRDRIATATQPISTGFVWIGRLVKFVVLICAVASLPLLVVWLGRWF